MADQSLIDAAREDFQASHAAGDGAAEISHHDGIVADVGGAHIEHGQGVIRLQRQIGAVELPLIARGLVARGQHIELHIRADRGQL